MALLEQQAPAYITPAEIASIMGVSRATVYSRVLCKGSGLPVHYLGRRRVVSRRAFFAWFEGRMDRCGA
ncbi:MAG: helix-turn-helix domain-containing protein [Actinomycetota bacterium]|nr:helix-turn-helix domain-containing protein [Actinomycetota bacterium]